MKKFWKMMLVAVMTLTAVFSFAGCGDDKLVVYTEAGFAPWEYMSGTEIVGVDVEIGKAIAKELGMEVEFKNVDFDTITEAVKTSPENSIGLAGMTIKTIDGITFSNPYYTSQQYILAKVGTVASANGEAPLTALAGMEVGAQLSTTGHTLLKSKEDSIGYNITENKKYDNLALMLNADRIDAIVMDELPAKSFLNKYTGLEVIKITGVDVESYGVAVASSNTELLEKVNKALEKIGAQQIQDWVDQYTEDASSQA